MTRQEVNEVNAQKMESIIENASHIWDIKTDYLHLYNGHYQMADKEGVDLFCYIDGMKGYTHAKLAPKMLENKNFRIEYHEVLGANREELVIDSNVVGKTLITIPIAHIKEVVATF